MASVYGGGKRSDFYGERKVLGEGKVPKLEKVEVMPMFLLSLFSSPPRLLFIKLLCELEVEEKASRPGKRGTISERFEELTSSRFPLPILRSESQRLFLASFLVWNCFVFNFLFVLFSCIVICA